MACFDRIHQQQQLNYYNNNLKKFKINKELVVDKAPLNFKWIGLIFKIFPGCKIISCLRDPMDVCWSNYKNWFAAKKLNFTYNLENLGNYYNSYKDLMIFWKNIFKDNIFDIYYEDLISDPDNKIKELSEYANRKEEISVDLNEEKIFYGNNEVEFKIDAFKKKCLLEGLDDIALSLKKSNKIENFENNLKDTKPWILND